MTWHSDGKGQVSWREGDTIVAGMYGRHFKGFLLNAWKNREQDGRTGVALARFCHTRAGPATFATRTSNICPTIPQGYLLFSWQDMPGLLAFWLFTVVYYLPCYQQVGLRQFSFEKDQHSHPHGRSSWTAVCIQCIYQMTCGRFFGCCVQHLFSTSQTCCTVLILPLFPFQHSQLLLFPM